MPTHPTGDFVFSVRTLARSVAPRQSGIFDVGSLVCMWNAMHVRLVLAFVAAFVCPANDSRFELWVPFGTYGDLWGPMGASGALWGPMGTFGDLWGPIGAYRDLCAPLGTYGDR